MAKNLILTAQFIGGLVFLVVALCFDGTMRDLRWLLIDGLCVAYLCLYPLPAAIIMWLYESSLPLKRLSVSAAMLVALVVAWACWLAAGGFYGKLVMAITLCLYAAIMSLGIILLMAKFLRSTRAFIRRLRFVLSA
jgi:hypothetical protein